MARWATLCEIAGVVFTGCRAEVQQAFQFASPYKGSVEWGNNGQANVQSINTGVKGNQFGIQMLTNEVDKIQDTLDAINTALGTHSTFIVLINDGLYNISANVEPDFTQEWFSHGKHSEGWLENIIFKFVTKSQYIP